MSETLEGSYQSPSSEGKGNGGVNLTFFGKLSSSTGNNGERRSSSRSARRCGQTGEVFLQSSQY